MVGYEGFQDRPVSGSLPAMEGVPLEPRQLAALLFVPQLRFRPRLPYQPPAHVPHGSSPNTSARAHAGDTPWCISTLTLSTSSAVRRRLLTSLTFERSG
jgi:hypothetical protein